MDLRDFIAAPLAIILVYVLAYVARPYLADGVTGRYYFPAITVKIIGALAIGFIYQFYYGGGDTFNYHTHGSRVIWEAFMANPTDGIKLFWGSNDPELFRYYSQIPFYQDPSSFFVVKTAAFFDFFTFSSYAATAVFFACISFLGSWVMYLTFYDIAPRMHGWVALSVFFVPSVFFWGSGIFKDTLTLASAGGIIFSVYQLFFRRKVSGWLIAVSIVCFYVLYIVKIYILLTLLPAIILWVFAFHFSRIPSVGWRVVSFPFIVILIVGFGFFAVKKAGEDNPKYSLDALAKTAQITAYDIRYWTGRDAGSGYSLGELDGTWQSMIRLAPQAVNVALFRPYLWEVNNPLMLLSALESLCFLILTAYLIVAPWYRIRKHLLNPHVLFCLTFSIAFGFAVGIATFNFGTLVRYKIPLMPLYLTALGLLMHYSKSERNVAVLEATE